MKDKGMWAGVATALPALILAVTGWMEVQTQKEKKQDLADNYSEYIQEQIVNEEHLTETLKVCMEGYRELAAGRAPERCPPCPELEPAVDYHAPAAKVRDVLEAVRPEEDQ